MQLDMQYHTRAETIRLLCCGEIVWQEISQRVSTVRDAGKIVGTDMHEALAICARTVCVGGYTSRVRLYTIESRLIRSTLTILRSLSTGITLNCYVVIATLKFTTKEKRIDDIQSMPTEKFF